MNIKTSSKLLVFSGAGLSADSGISTFRDKDGLWRNSDLNKVCNFQTWEENYDLVHEFYGDRRLEIAKAEPNIMHLALAELQLKYGAERVELWTQNIDNLLEHAGAIDVKHVHGYLTEMVCTKCDNIWDIGYAIEIDHHCINCGHDVIKPNVVFFGQHVPEYGPMITSFHEARKNKNNTILVIGTSGNVVPFNWIIGSYNESKEAYKILCNKEKIDSDLSIFDMCFIDSAVNVASDLKRALIDRLEGVLTR